MLEFINEEWDSWISEEMIRGLWTVLLKSELMNWLVQGELNLPWLRFLLHCICEFLQWTGTFKLYNARKDLCWANVSLDFGKNILEKTKRYRIWIAHLQQPCRRKDCCIFHSVLQSFWQAEQRSSALFMILNRGFSKRPTRGQEQITKRQLPNNKLVMQLWGAALGSPCVKSWKVLSHLVSSCPLISYLILSLKIHTVLILKWLCFWCSLPEQSETYSKTINNANISF